MLINALLTIHRTLEYPECLQMLISSDNILTNGSSSAIVRFSKTFECREHRNNVFKEMLKLFLKRCIKELARIFLRNNGAILVLVLYIT